MQHTIRSIFSWAKIGGDTPEPPPVEELSTTLFTDGTLIINEWKTKDREANIAKHGAVTNEYEPGPYDIAMQFDIPWFDEASNITAAEFGSVYKPTSTSHLFNNLVNLSSIDCSKLDTSDLVNTTCMFRNCSSLLDFPDVSDWDVSKVTTAYSMFTGCSSLKTPPNVSRWDTSNLQYSDDMFSGCSSLETPPDVSKWDTTSLSNATNMFENCKSITQLDLSGWNTGALINTAGMFANCEDLVNIFVNSTTFRTQQITNSTGMFTMCASLVGGAGTTYDSTKTDKTYARVDNPPDAPGYFTAK